MECGNLSLALKDKRIKNSYIFFMQNDTNTNGYTRWFYFSIKNAKPNITYKFSIVNFRKKFNFFNEGFKPFVFSLIEARENGNGWSINAKKVKF
jgi:hypothetical protein